MADAILLFDLRQIMRRQLTKDEQIRGLRKALASRKTPKQFRASMRKRLAKLEGK